MGDNPKERGKHNRITKHKNKTKTQPAKLKPKPKLESNWDRYQTEQELPIISGSTDFASLASAPITQGSHFQFKSDKAVIDEGDTALELFNLDLKLLSKSLATVPFYIRNGIDEKLFTSTQKKIMEKSGQPDQDLGQNNVIYPPVKSIFFEEEESSGSETESNDSIINDNEDVSELQKPHEDDLEQWLDDILDD